MHEILLEGKQLKRNQVTGMHLMVGFLLIAIGVVTWAVPDTVKQTALHFLNYVGLVYLFLGVIIVIVCMFFNKRIIQTQANTALRIIEIIALSIILIYSLSKSWYLPAGYSITALLGIIAALYFEKIGKKDKKAFFNEEGIFIEGFFVKKRTSWEDIRNVILKHGILTIDKRNNKLLQLNISKNNINKEFVAVESYAKNLIKKNEDKYQKDW